MTEQIERRRGGCFRPITPRDFILAYLAQNGEAYIAEMHRTYKAELDRIWEENATVPEWKGKGRKPFRPKGKRYHKPRYHSFQQTVWNMQREGLIRFVRASPTIGTEEQFKGFQELPLRHYFALM